MNDPHITQVCAFSPRLLFANDLEVSAALYAKSCHSAARPIFVEVNCFARPQPVQASTYRNQGRWKEAEELFVQVKEIRKRVLGEEHPSTLTSMANLASTYRNQGRWKEAEELEVQVMDIRKRVLGEEHPDTLISMNNLAHTQKQRGQFSDSIVLLCTCLELCNKVLGPTHPHTQTVAITLESWQQEQKLNDAERASTTPAASSK